MMRLAVIALVCTLAVPARAEFDGGVLEGALDRVVFDVELGDLKITDAGMVHVLGGCWLDTRTCIAEGREMVALRAEDASLKSSAIPPPVWLAFVVGVVAAAGFAAGFVVGHR